MSWPQALGSAGRLLQEQVLHRPDFNTVYHPRTVILCNSPLYINLIDYEKAFDSLDQQSLWKLLRHCGIPEKITSIIWNSYKGMTCRMVRGHQLTDAFQVKTGVIQGCLLSPFLFLLAIDWVLKTSTAQRENGIQQTPWTQPGDLDLADDLTLLSHIQWQWQMKTSTVADNSAHLSWRSTGIKSKAYMSYAHFYEDLVTSLWSCRI